MSTPAAEIVAPGEQGFKEREAHARRTEDTDAGQGGLAWIGRFTRRLGRLPDYLMIGSIVTLVVLTSLPRLREFVVRSNEIDARDTLVRLAALDLDHSNLGDLMDSSPSLRRRFQDGVLTEDGELLRFHGFCFAIARPGDDGENPGGWRLLAWPELFGRSGVRTFCASSAGGFWAHPNARGRWSGPQFPTLGIELGSDGGWIQWDRTSRGPVR